MDAIPPYLTGLVLQVLPGVNTGFGGSANTGTNNVKKLQLDLINFLNCGVISPPPAYSFGRKSSQLSNGTHHTHEDLSGFGQALPNEDPLASSTMPESWVRATLLIRSNALSGGHSGVRSSVINSVVDLLNKNITPIIPLRGSISASGDLIPLSYIAATLQGSSQVEVWTDDNSGNPGRKRITAEMALSQWPSAPLSLGPKEGLAIVNGTAVSAAVGSLALHDAHAVFILSQALTAMGVEVRGSPNLPSFNTEATLNHKTSGENRVRLTSKLCFMAYRCHRSPPYNDVADLDNCAGSLWLG